MTDAQKPWPLDLTLVGICGNDYESLEIIRDQLAEDFPRLAVEALLQCLRELQARGWIVGYRGVLERVAPDPGPDATLEQKRKQWRSEFVPVPEFSDDEATELWWLSTEKGLSALKATPEWKSMAEPDGEV